MATKKKEESVELIPTDKIKNDIQLFIDKKSHLTTLVESSKSFGEEEAATKEGFEQMVIIRKALKAERVKITKDGKSIRDMIRPLMENVSIKERELIAIIEGEEERLLQIEEAVNKKKEEERKEKNRLRDEMIHNRTTVLLQLGLAYNGIDYSIEHGEEKLTITPLDIINLKEDQFTTFLSNVKRVVDSIEEVKKEKERIETTYQKRIDQLSLYNYEWTDVDNSLGAMPDDVYSKFLQNVIDKFKKEEAEKQAEKKALEARTKARKELLIEIGFKEEGSLFKHESLSPISSSSIIELIDVDFADILASCRKQIEANNTLKRLQEEEKQKQAERVKEHNEKVAKRQQNCVDIGMNFNGSYYIYKDLKIGSNQISTLSSEDWALLLSETNTFIKKEQAEEIRLRNEKEQRDAMLKVRIQLLKQHGYVHDSNTVLAHNKFGKLFVTIESIEKMEDQEFISYVENLDHEISHEEKKLVDAQNALKSDKEKLKMWIDQFIFKGIDIESLSEPAKNAVQGISKSYNDFKEAANVIIEKLK